MDRKQLEARLNKLIELGQAALQTRRKVEWMEYLDPTSQSTFRSASLSFIRSTFGENHPHYIEFEKGTTKQEPINAQKGLGILEAIRLEIAGGWVASIKSLVAGEVFSDFLEMAQHLLDSHYKDPAAVLGGCVLEDHIRRLCQQHGIAIEEEKDGKMIPLKADRLNSLLAKAEVYSVLEQKQITAWLDLRNKAAHGQFSEYSAEQVQLLLLGVGQFLLRIQ
jgi:hypothetical protein